MVCCGVAVVGAFIIRDLRAANAEAQEIYTGSVHGLQRIGELQYEAQETRRATLYALTTTDSNLQVEYADQTRNADRRVTDGIAEYRSQAKSPPRCCRLPTGSITTGSLISACATKCWLPFSREARRKP